MSLFGWSLPPGCSQRDIDCAYGYEVPCEVCGHGVDDCICPECPVCLNQGDTKCYVEHGLTRTPEQIAGAAALQQSYDEQAAADKAEGDYWASPDRLKEEQ